MTGLFQLVLTSRGNQQLIFGDYLYSREYRNGDRVYWRCVSCNKTKCRARVITNGGELEIRSLEHNHEPHTASIRDKLLWQERRLQQAKYYLWGVRQQTCPLEYGPRLFQLVLTSRGNQQLIYSDHVYSKDYNNCGRIYWRCVSWKKTKCRARVITSGDGLDVRGPEHNHEPHTEIIRNKLLWQERRLQQANPWGNPQLVHKGYLFKTQHNRPSRRRYWRCVDCNKTRCHARAITDGEGIEIRAVQFVQSARGNPQLVYNGCLFNSEYKRGERQFWQCSYCQRTKCRARVATCGSRLEVRQGHHNHGPHTDAIRKKLLWNAMCAGLEQH
ncbi:FLYWCH-type zinc finger-containing protein 1-like [Bacillus rossius redtenbacheri]|uniref:FLYWCH-type zinc finger-containing protein 1-like n=1 Tax=Bacillus rossius redtenbacheri TaxID=93214 RepID=UPI002FDCFA5D